MQQVQQLDHQIAMLVQHLPQQRQQLTVQTRAVLKAVHGKLSSPAALAVATVSGALIGWGLYRHDSTTSTGNTTSILAISSWVITRWLTLSRSSDSQR
ncbi:hypothetical protein P2G88_11900 [Aliiglaciecola sp. CAU 1673]|uniref:hypothetical protein n=1 Tax=Aliiglaciecola sp. CAU 1673 TaxID=3032595 RepID=UPI0023DAA3C6|nr:hypothetical protein [Aliiglaciecola sp. CAU 1673]MDF2178954.1 hypothetical protein [Aliiglaciecola sp. CAU 1673]